MDPLPGQPDQMAQIMQMLQQLLMYAEQDHKQDMAEAGQEQGEPAGPPAQEQPATPVDARTAALARLKGAGFGGR